MPEPLLQRLQRHAAERPEATAYLEILPDGAPGRMLTYGQLHQRAEALAGELRQRANPGEAVLIHLPNTIEFPIAFFATFLAGCSALLMSPQSAEAEVAKAMESARVRLMLRAAEGGLAWERRGSGFLDLPVPNPESRNTVPGLILQSSGTTGRPSLVLRALGAVDAVSRQMVEAVGFTPDDRVLCAIPLCHSYGIEHGLLAPIHAGSAVHLCPGMNLPAMLRQLTAGGITLFPGTPSIFELLAQTGERGVRLPALRAAYSAGAPLPRAVFDAFADTFSVRVGQLYGATEVGSVTYNDPNAPGFDPAGVGRPMRQVQIRIAPLEDPAGTLPPDQEGQVCIRAASMLQCYLGRDVSPLCEGYFLTADLGRLDASGNLTITGRQKLLIDVGGLKVNPMEVEEVLMRHPAVAACVVVPVRQSHTVFRLKAVLTARNPDDPPSSQALRDFARQALAPHKVPRLFEWRPSLPRSPTGKILRHLVSVGGVADPASTRAGSTISATVLLLCLLLLPLLLMGGCAHQPPLPTYPGLTDSAALNILAQRGRSVQALSGQGSLELIQPDGQSVRLEAALAMRLPNQMRLRAWKFSQAVLDLTITPQGVWIVAPRAQGRREQILSAGARAAEFAKAWSLFTLFDRPGVTTSDQDGQLVVRQSAPGEPAILCHVDRRTLTPRRYDILDDTGKVRFTLRLDRYRNFNGIVWPQRMKATGPHGTILLTLRDLELNGDIPAAAFTPPPRAERLP